MIAIPSQFLMLIIMHLLSAYLITLIISAFYPHVFLPILVAKPFSSSPLTFNPAWSLYIP